MYQYDVIVIGGGPGGYESAFEGAREGLKVALIEQNRIGGVCLHAGCIPTKTYYNYAHTLHRLKDMEEYGLRTTPQMNWDAMKEYKNQVIDRLTDQLEKEAKRLGITTYKGVGSVLGDHQVSIATEDSNQIIDGEYVIEATGSVEIQLPIEGIKHCMFASDLLNIDQIPKHIVIIGAGVIGMEMASIFNAFGSTVTVIEKTSRMLPSFGEGLVKRLKPSIKKQGIQVIFDSEVVAITRTDTMDYSIRYKKNEQAMHMDASAVLCAVGRRSPLESMDKDSLSPWRVQVGDCAGNTYLAHDAKKQGIMAIRRILKKHVKDEHVKVQVAFTIPPIAEAYKEPKPMSLEGAETTHFKSSGMALAQQSTTGVCLLKANDLYNTIDYMGIIGEQAHELINIGVVAMENKLTVDRLASSLFAHPSLSEIIGDVAAKSNH